MTTTVTVLLFLLFPIHIFCYTNTAINLLVRSPSDSTRYCIDVATLPNGRYVNVTYFGWRKPYLASSSVNPCDVSTLNQTFPNGFSSNTMLILYEHDCKMTEHAWNVQTAFGSNISLMIITTRTDTQYELTYNTTAMPVSIPVAVFWQEDFKKLQNRFKNFDTIELSIAYPPDDSRKFRPAVLLMFLLVFFVLLCGNLWAADEFKKKIQVDKPKENIQQTPPPPTSSTLANTNNRPLTRILSKNGSISPSEISSTDVSSKAEPAVIPITCCVIIIIICFAVGWLLLLYFFPSVMIYILQGKYEFIYP